MAKKSQVNLANRPSVRFLTNNSTYDINMIGGYMFGYSRVSNPYPNPNPNPNPNPSLTLTLTLTLKQHLFKKKKTDPGPGPYPSFYWQPDLTTTWLT